VNWLRRLYRGEQHFDVVRRRRLFLSVALGVVVVSMVLLLVRGLNLGIEFEGGVVWEFPANDASSEEVRATMEEAGVPDARIQSVGDDFFRVRAEAADIDQQQAVTEGLAELAGVPTSEVSRAEVGPSWGDEITSKAIRALIVFAVVITLYLTLRLEWKMAIAAMTALVHDVAFTVGFYSLTAIEVTPATVIAFLTIMGYSLYDTIIVFDRVRENSALLSARGRFTYPEVVNTALNEVLMRSLNTSIAAILPVFAMLVVGSWVLGAVALEEFAIALLVGLFIGAYSSIFIAAPMLVVIKEREPAWAARQRVADASGTGSDPRAVREAVAATAYNRPTAPRPRKHVRRRTGPKR
jgi:preprotein translocase subunit SecF